MDNLKIGIRADRQARTAARPRSAAVLGPTGAGVAITLATTVIAAFAGCASAPTPTVPARAATHASLVAPSDASLATGRNDARLGTPRQPFARTAAEGVATIDDRQWIVNGRPYADYESRVRSTTAFSR